MIHPDLRCAFGYGYNYGEGKPYVEITELTAAPGDSEIGSETSREIGNTVKIEEGNCT